MTMVTSRGPDRVEEALPPFSVTIASSGDAILAGPGVQKAGSPIFLLVTLANNSTRTVSIPSFDRDYYRIDVRDEQGKTVPQTDEARKMPKDTPTPTTSTQPRHATKASTTVL